VCARNGEDLIDQYWRCNVDCVGGRERDTEADVPATGTGSSYFGRPLVVCDPLRLDGNRCNAFVWITECHRYSMRFQRKFFDGLELDNDIDRTSVNGRDGDIGHRSWVMQMDEEAFICSSRFRTGLRDEMQRGQYCKKGHIELDYFHCVILTSLQVNGMLDPQHC